MDVTRSILNVFRFQMSKSKFAPQICDAPFRSSVERRRESALLQSRSIKLLTKLFRFGCNTFSINVQILISTAIGRKLNFAGTYLGVGN